ncbi:MAG: hypothetical protein HQK79_23045 [Desulfobacterales bacterium]|nr:hypothetical protein [Desulfobacterales bacterium]
MLWKESGLKILGVTDETISPYLKTWVKQGNVCVVGITGEGTSREVTANWTSPFEQDSLGGKFQRMGGLVQMITHKTAKTKLNSIQTWEGNKPHQFNLVLKFFAQTDAKREVSDAIAALEKMMCPEVSENIPTANSMGGAMKDAAVNFVTGKTFREVIKGRPPEPVWINIGRQNIVGDCVIAHITEPLDKEKTRDGYLIRAEVTLQVESLTMLNSSEIEATY